MKQICTISCEYNPVCVLTMDRYVVTSSTYEKNLLSHNIFDNLMSLELFCKYGFPFFIYDSYTCSSTLAFSIQC